ncbi:hypothetical protein L2E82_38537 [Cichorium intybus]|uniref:Uncharacterized protein n=1 Tax=Cichorium intybus TaxID=13427 RepID=A0ACB9AG44_CICIN|nr:hypothetical protein L2E82_38537 [Cichorium intybus]
MLVKFMTLALQCVEYNPTAMPTVQDVLWALEQMVAKYHHRKSVLDFGVVCLLRLIRDHFESHGVNMFQLSILEHTLRLKPDILSLPVNEAVKGELEAIFLDKVITDLGLCISVYDIESINGGKIQADNVSDTWIFLMTYTYQTCYYQILPVLNLTLHTHCTQIRFRVQSIEFPEIPKGQKDSKPFAPMEIIVFE